ncbi:MAG TPA: hypothetical protein VIK54_08955 [Acidimicrobiia bacterium]
MTDLSDRALRAAALGFACATGYNSVVAIRETAPGEPLGIRIPLSVSTATLVGWGSAVAAPWPMPVVALAAARHAGRDGATGPALVCAGLGVAGIVGILIEPNTYNARSWTPAIRRAVLAHVATCLTLAGAGIWQLRRPRRIEPVRGVG